jgi:polyisoprenoid-binding protein YceI
MTSLPTHLRVITLVCSFVLVSAIADAEMAQYDVDPEHTTIGFSAVHMLVSNVRGQFMDYSGFIELDPDAKSVKTIETTIKTASINTNHEKRDTHLRSPDFFDVEKHTTMTYKLKSYRKTGDQYTALGSLTLHGVTKDPMGNIRAGFTAEGKINRRDFDVNFSKTLDTGGLIVGDEQAGYRVS